MVETIRHWLNAAHDGCRRPPGAGSGASSILAPVCGTMVDSVRQSAQDRAGDCGRSPAVTQITRQYADGESLLQQAVTAKRFISALRSGESRADTRWICELSMRGVGATRVHIRRTTPACRRAARACSIPSPPGTPGRLCRIAHRSDATRALPDSRPATRRLPTRCAIACTYDADRSRNRLGRACPRRRSSQTKQGESLRRRLTLRLRRCFE